MSTTSRPKSRSRKKKPRAAAQKKNPAPANLARWLAHADWSTALLLLGAYWLLDLPSIRIGYDSVHQTNLLMSSLRIWQGQVPFRDFYPWYGPLFHYFAAGWVWLLGGNLLAVKLFIKVISPLLSMAMLIATLRMFRLPAQGRFFAVAASSWWVFESYFLMATTRTFLGLFLIGLWMALIRKPERPWGRRLIFPSSLLALLYSPEIGLYLQPVILVIIFFDLLELPSPRHKKDAALAYGAGALLTLGLFAGSWLAFTWFRNYVHFFLYTSSNMIWAYSLPLPELGDFFTSPRQWLHILPWPVLTLAGAKAASPGKLLFFLPWPVLAITSGWLLLTIRRGKISQIPVWIPACVGYGLMLWTTTYLRMDGGHLLWALPPIMILLGQLFSRPSPGGAIKLALLALLLWGWPFFLYAPPNLSYWKNLGHPTRFWDSWPTFSGVRVSPVENKMFEDLQAFIQAHPHEEILFPLHSFDAYRLGQPLRLPFDDLFWANYPEHQQKLLELVQKRNAPYICLDLNYFFYVYMHEDLHALGDYIATHYHPLQVIYSSILYERLPEPRVLAQKIQSLPGPLVLSKPNNFQAEWELPSDFSGGYLEMHEAFAYSSRWFQRFSRPLVKISLNDQPLNREIVDGPSRIRNTAGGGNDRVYVPKGVKKVTFAILFPGLLNLKAESVTLQDIGLYQFNFPPPAPYTANFLKNGY